MKYCKKCDTSKLLDDFYNNRRNRDGKASYCKPCWNDYMRAQGVKHRERKAASNARWLEANRERKAAQTKAWRAANSDRLKAQGAEYRKANHESILAKSRARRELTKDEAKAKYRANPEPTRQRVREYNRRNAERNVLRVKQWREANPDRYREHMRIAAARRRARKASLPTYVVTEKDFRRLMSGPCAVAGCTSTDIQIDHVIPIARGGSHGVGNFQSLCSSHNQSKAARTWMEFRLYLRMKAQLAA